MSVFKVLKIMFHFIFVCPLVMMPFWSFTLGRVIFQSGSMVIPYLDIFKSAASLLIPLSIGFAVQKFLPNVSRLMVRILKPLSALIIIFIIIFATATNLYLLQLFTWQVIVLTMYLWVYLMLSFYWLVARMQQKWENEAMAQHNIKI